MIHIRITNLKYMKKASLYLLIFLASCTSTKEAAKDVVNATLTPKEKIQTFQKELSEKYSNPTTSPLREGAADFKGHEFYPIDLKYRVEAKLTRYKEEPFFKMPTSGPKTPEYRKYGLLQFEIAGRAYELTIFQNLSSMRNPLYRDYLFLPFTDLTNGEKTYGGGRYIDIRIPKGETMIIDFNQAYNPYCAYTTGYSCPIPPEENHLDLAVEAGIMLKK